MSALRNPQPLDMQDAMKSLRRDMVIKFRAMLNALDDHDPRGYKLAQAGFDKAAKGAGAALSTETWAPGADEQSSSVLAQEIPGVPASLVAMHQAGVLRTLHEDERDNG